MTTSEIDKARAVCVECRVRRDCLLVALLEDQRWGVWGGFTYTEREAMLARHNDSIARAVRYGGSDTKLLALVMSP